MSETFEIASSATKKEILDQFDRLMAAYKKKVEEAAELHKRLGEAEKHKASEVAKCAGNTTVHGVVETLGALRTQFGKAINDLTDQMLGQAEKLETISKAIVVQEARLKELHDIEAAADTLARLVSGWEERKMATEADFTARLKEMEETWHARISTLEADYSQRKATLETDLASRKEKLEKDLSEKKEHLTREIDETRTVWKRETEKSDAAMQEAEELRTKTREREESEYLYQRDRSRKLEEDGYEQRRETLERELAEKKATVEKALKEREAAVAAQEKELKSLREQVERFPTTLEKEIDKARKETAAMTARDHQQDTSRSDLERTWERKVYEERIKHMEATIQSQESKIDELKKDLNGATRQVQQIADKAIEGASLGRAFQSVNQIALEQARRGEGKGNEPGQNR